ncbi:MAG: 50S ribosomal protein L21 [Alphaproteobacteria bacterium]|jgi:large subunit ribosomal protein L21
MLMYAVVQTGGKQYRVTAGDTFQVEKLAGNAGDTVKLERVLALMNNGKPLLGNPMIAGAVVEAQIIDTAKGEKVLIFKKKRRHNYRRKNGHRQTLTTLHVTNILYNGTSLVSAQPKKIEAEKKAAAAPAKAKKVTAAAKPAAKKAAPKKAAETKKPAAKKAATKKAK